MSILNRVLFLTLIFEFLLFLQELKIASILDTNPNFLLIFFFVIVFTNEKFAIVLSTLIAVLIIAIIFTPFWIWQIAVLLALIFLINLFRNLLTGKELADFLIAIILGTIMFYVFINVPNLKFLTISSIFWELVYNLILGTIAWFLFQKYGLKKQKTFR